MRRLPLGWILSAVAVTCSGFACGAANAAVQPRAGWSITAEAEPTDFSASQSSVCEAEAEGQRGQYCDSYAVMVTNAGAKPTNGEPITISDTVPAGLRIERVATRSVLGGGQVFEEQGFDFKTGETFPCSHTLSTATCEYSGIVTPGDFLLIMVDVLVEPSLESGGQQATNTVRAEGGGAPPVTTVASNAVNSVASPFGIQDFSLTPFAEDGTVDLQAGDHPYAMTSTFELTKVFKRRKAAEGSTGFYEPVEEAKDVIVYLPLGLTGDPLAAPTCSETQLEAEEPGLKLATKCPADSRIGTVTISDGGVYTSSLREKDTFTSAVYNVAPEGGYPAALGFFYIRAAVIMYASIVPASSVVPGDTGYMLRITVPDIIRPGIKTVDGASLTIFGNPAQHNKAEGSQLSASSAFFSNPVDCESGPLTAKIEADSWEKPGVYVSRQATVYPQVTGCDLLQFDPAIEARAETSQADEPTGYDVKLNVPQPPNISPDLASGDIKDVTVSLPQGVSVSPAAADGLKACPATGPEGFNLEGPESIEMGEGSRNGSPYDDGFAHTAPGHCPLASKIGTVEIATPLLQNPLEGAEYVAQPGCGSGLLPPCTDADAADGNLFKIYVEASGSGAIVKLQGSISANPATGQLTAHFENNPELPVSEVDLKQESGPRAPLANPQTCGLATTTADLTPWSSPQTPDATPAWQAPVDGCEGALFNPGFLAQMQVAQAGSFSPFVMVLTRKDREEDLAGLQVRMPPGLLGKLSSVTPCGEPLAAAGTCQQGSEIGSVTAASGAGSHPLLLTGHAYLTSGYRGAPFGLSVVVPAQAGPFNLGDVVVRAAINVDPHTSALTVTSDPLPQIIDGVPLRLQAIEITVNRPDFMLNPTNCRMKQIGATTVSASGAIANATTPFTAAGCKALAFKPSFTVSTQRKSTKRYGASLDVKITQKHGEANIAKVAVTLPRLLPARLTTIQQACPEDVFKANPATCPAGSDVGIATASTPVLTSRLVGPAYLVSHGNARFPDLDVILQGSGVVVVLEGSINISSRNVTSSTFSAVPDVPITSFELKLPRSAHSALTAENRDLCGKTLSMPTVIKGQNGAEVKQRTKIRVRGCFKRKKRDTKKNSHARKGRRR